MNKIKIYSPSQIASATFIGGPVGAVYTLKKNFDALGKKTEAKATLIWGTVFTILLFSTLPFVPAHFPNFVIPLAYTIAARTIAEQYQLPKKAIKDSDQYELQGNWKVCGLGIAFLIATLVVLFAGFYGLAVLDIIPVDSTGT